MGSIVLSNPPEDPCSQVQKQLLWVQTQFAFNRLIVGGHPTTVLYNHLPSYSLLDQQFDAKYTSILLAQHGIYTYDTFESSPVSGIIHYPRESDSALETFDVALKMSPIPNQKNCRDPLQRSVTATNLGGESLWDRLSGVARGSENLGRETGTCLIVSQIKWDVFAEIIWRAQRNLAHAV